MKYQLVKKATDINYFKRIVYILLNKDRRVQFYDLSRIKPLNRKPKSPIINLYDSVDNIGNYTPTLGIQKMLGQVPDTWCIKDQNIDFDFINRNYKCVIIGGAGIIGIGFQKFWYKFLTELANSLIKEVPDAIRIKIKFILNLLSCKVKHEYVKLSPEQKKYLLDELKEESEILRGKYNFDLSRWNIK